MTTSLAQNSGEREELRISHRGEEFVLVPTDYGYELLTIHRLPVNTAYPPSPKTGRLYSVGNIEPQSKSEGFYGRKSEGYKAPQIRGEAQPTPQAAAHKLLGWLNRKTRKAVA